jgi:hypothetical protein
VPYLHQHLVANLPARPPDAIEEAAAEDWEAEEAEATDAAAAAVAGSSGSSGQGGSSSSLTSDSHPPACIPGARAAALPWPRGAAVRG